MLDTKKYTKNGPYKVYLLNKRTGNKTSLNWCYRPEKTDTGYIQIVRKTLYSLTVYNYRISEYKILTIKSM